MLESSVETLNNAWGSSPNEESNSEENGLRTANALLRCMTFIDGSWLYHNQEMLTKAYGGAYKLDFGKINTVALRYLRQQYGRNLQWEVPYFDLVRTYYYASVPANVHPDDLPKLEDQRNFYSILSDSLGFELVLHEIDFRGHYMAMEDRLKLEGEANFLPKERTIDMALGTTMLYFAAINAFDVAIAVLGDSDYQPALDRVRQLGKRVLIFAIEGSASYDYLYPKPNARYGDFPTILFQSYLEDLRLIPRGERERPVYRYHCARCGKPFESTYKAPPRQNMYCSDHRIYKDRNNGSTADDQSQNGDATGDYVDQAGEEIAKESDPGKNDSEVTSS